MSCQAHNPFLFMVLRRSVRWIIADGRPIEADRRSRKLLNPGVNNGSSAGKAAAMRNPPSSRCAAAGLRRQKTTIPVSGNGVIRRDARQIPCTGLDSAALGPADGFRVPDPACDGFRVLDPACDEFRVLDPGVRRGDGEGRKPK